MKETHFMASDWYAAASRAYGVEPSQEFLDWADVQNNTIDIEGHDVGDPDCPICCGTRRVFREDFDDVGSSIAEYWIPCACTDDLGAEEPRMVFDEACFDADALWRSLGGSTAQPPTLVSEDGKLTLTIIKGREPEGEWIETIGPLLQLDSIHHHNFVRIDNEWMEFSKVEPTEAGCRLFVHRFGHQERPALPEGGEDE